MKYLIFICMLSCTSVMDSKRTNQDKAPTQDTLHYVVRPQKDTTTKAPVLVLLHGYGSNENDLFSFANKIPDNWLVVAVRAPIEIGENRYKWYDVKLVEEKITMNFDDEERSRKLLLNCIDNLALEYNIDTSKVITAGFSQGANMALGLGLTAPKKVLAAGCFSGRFMEEIKPLVQDISALKKKQVFLSHGTEDRMLPMRYVEENRAILEAWGIQVTLSLDNVAHSISNKQLNDFVEWMQGF